MAEPANSATRVSLLVRLRDDPGDERSWAQFVGRYGAMIQRWCAAWGLQEADAQDVTQNVLLKIAGHMRRFEYRRDGRFRAWLRKVAYHAWCDYLDAKRKSVSASGHDDVRDMLHSIEARDNFLQAVEDECEKNLLEDAMALVEQRVEPHVWRAFYETAIAGRPGTEVARELGMKTGTVYVAKNRVQKMITEEVNLFETDESAHEQR